MSRSQTIWLAISLLILSSLACNAFAGEIEPGLTLPPPAAVTEATATPGAALDLAPTATLPGGATEAPLVDATGRPLLEALVDVNVRTGPSVQYVRDGFLFAGEAARVLGRDPASGWWKIECPGRSEGSECWVSGGTQYTKVTNREGVPVAAAPPTPTPPPTPEPLDGPEGATIAGNTGLLAYAGEDGLWLVTLDMSQEPPTGSEPAPLNDTPNVERPLISPDGRKIAYLTSTTESNSLHLIDLDEGSDDILVSSADLPVMAEADTAVLLSQVAWLSDSQGLVFNTTMRSLIGPGLGQREDLWQVMVDGAVKERVMAGSGGGVFALAADDQIIFGGAEAMIRASLDGVEESPLLTFDFINTASEYVYHPQAQWTADSGAAYVAIPNADPWGPEAGATLWRIPAAGPAEELETLSGNILFSPFHWTPDGDQLAYVMVEMDAANPSPVLILADGDGRNAVPYTSDDQLTLSGWSPDGAHFLYAGGDYYAIGQADVPPKKIESAGGVGAMQWLTASTFVAATTAGNIWTLVGSDLTGETTTLAAGGDTPPPFDVWTP